MPRSLCCSRNLCDGFGSEPGTAIDRFNPGLDIARNARRVAREQFAGKED